MKIKKILVFVYIISLCSCSSEIFENEQDLWTYLKETENGYLQQKKINRYDFSLLSMPTDLLVIQELGEDRSKVKIKKLRDKYKKYMYFTLSISRDSKELLSAAPKTRQEFGEMVNQLAFGMKEKVHLFTQKKDTLTMLDYNYPRMYGMSQSTSILFVYPREKKYLKEGVLNFTIQDIGTYTGEVRFKIDVNQIKKQLRLKL